MKYSEAGVWSLDSMIKRIKNRSREKTGCGFLSVVNAGLSFLDLKVVEKIFDFKGGCFRSI